jgi:HEAT repeat protein
MATGTLPPTEPNSRNPGTPPERRLATIAQNLRDLGSRDVRVVESAEQRLGDLAPQPAELLELLNHRDPFVRSGSAKQLRSSTGPIVAEVIDALRAAIDDSNDHVVEAVLGSLGVLRAEGAVSDIRACLDDSNPRVVHAAIFALGRIGLEEEGAHLGRFLSSNHFHIQASAIHSLVLLRYRPAIPALLAQLETCQGVIRNNRTEFELPRRLIHALVSLQAREAIPLLIRTAQDEIGVRGVAVQALIDLHAEEAGPALLPLLGRLFDSQHEERLCTSLLFLMRRLNYRFALPEVRRHLGHRLAVLRCAALRVLASWHDLEAVQTVRTMCQQDASAFVRPCAVETLARLLGLQALPDLQALANDTNTLVRRAVADALGRLKPLPPEGQELLARLLADEAVTRVSVQTPPRPNGQAKVETLRPLEEMALVPDELWSQVPAARAFLQRWQSHLPLLAADHDSAEMAEIEKALNVLLGALGRGS